MIIATLGKDPEIRYTTGGLAIANFCIATSEEWKDSRATTRKRAPNGVALSLWANWVNMRRIPLKGKHVFIEGPIQTKSWDDKESNKKYTTEIVMTECAGSGKERLGDSSKKARHHDDDAMDRGVATTIIHHDTE